MIDEDVSRHDCSPLVPKLSLGTMKAKLSFGPQISFPSTIWERADKTILTPL